MRLVYWRRTIAITENIATIIPRGMYLGASWSYRTVNSDISLTILLKSLYQQFYYSSHFIRKFIVVVAFNFMHGFLIMPKIINLSAFKMKHNLKWKDYIDQNLKSLLGIMLKLPMTFQRHSLSFYPIANASSFFADLPLTIRYMFGFNADFIT